MANNHEIEFKLEVYGLTIAVEQLTNHKSEPNSFSVKITTPTRTFTKELKYEPDPNSKGVAFDIALRIVDKCEDKISEEFKNLFIYGVRDKYKGKPNGFLGR